MVEVFLVVLLYVSGTSLLEQHVAVVHESAQTIESLYHLARIGDNRFVVVLLESGHEMVGDGVVHAELHFLRVYQYELHLVGMLLV